MLQEIITILHLDISRYLPRTRANLFNVCLGKRHGYYLKRMRVSYRRNRYLWTNVNQERLHSPKATAAVKMRPFIVLLLEFAKVNDEAEETCSNPISFLDFQLLLQLYILPLFRLTQIRLLIRYGFGYRPSEGYESQSPNWLFR